MTSGDGEAVPRVRLSADGESRPCDWTHFVGRSGAAGREWVEEYCGFDAVQQAYRRALEELRAGRLKAGRELLDRGRRLLRAGPDTGSVRHVLDRWRFGVEAYYFYRTHDLDRAERLLGRAHDAVQAAIDGHRFLLPLSNHCHEFRLHRCRIARSRDRWDEMRRHVEVARGMMEDRLPFCVLADGTPIHVRNLKQYYHSLGGLSPDEMATLCGLLNDGLRLQLFARFVCAIYAVPGLVIPYH